MTAGASGAYPIADVARLRTVVETPAYLSAARGVLSDTLRERVVDMVAENPEVGEDAPLFLLTVFAKNEKASLTAGERAALIGAAKKLAADYRRDT